MTSNLVLFIMHGCSACIAAKTLLRRKGYEYQEKNVTAANQLPNGADGTLPQLVYNGQLIGGLNRMNSWLQNVPDIQQQQQPQAQRPQQQQAQRPQAAPKKQEQDLFDVVMSSTDPKSGGGGPQETCTFDNCFGTQ